MLAQLGGSCLSDLTWTTIMDSQLSPVLTYGSHLWKLSRSSTVKMVNQGYKKGIRRGLGIRYRDSVQDRLENGLSKHLRK